MKCYVHRDTDAIGVCSECGQGICDICAVRIGGKLYCKEDADRVFGSRKEEKESWVSVAGRPMRVSVLSVAFFLYGFFGVIVGLVSIAAGLAAGSLSDYYFGFSSAASTSVYLLSLGGLLFVMGVLGIICGVWLWKGQTTGAVVGIPLLLGGLAIVSILDLRFPSQSLSTYEVIGIVWTVNVILLTILIASWTKLRWS